MPHPAFALPIRTAGCIRRLPLFGVVAVSLLSACSEPVAPNEALLSRPASIVVIDGRDLVYNLQLRSIDDPNIIDDPNLRSQGHIRFTLAENADGTFTLAWKGQIFNPDGETFTGWSMTHVESGRPSLFVAIGEVDGISDRFLEPDGGDIISAEMTAALFGAVEPDDSGTEPDGGDFGQIPPDVGDYHIKVVFFTVERPAGALSGTM